MRSWPSADPMNGLGVAAAAGSSQARNCTMSSLAKLMVAVAGIVALQAPFAIAADFGIGGIGFQVRAEDVTLRSYRQVGIAQCLIGYLQAVAGDIGVERGEAKLRMPPARAGRYPSSPSAGDLHRAFQVGILFCIVSDLFQRSRVGAHPQLQMAGIEMAGRMTVGGIDAGLSVAGVQLPAGHFDRGWRCSSNGP